MTTTKHPWTTWTIYIYSGSCAALVSLLWALGVEYPKSGWAVIIFWVPLFLLYWRDGLKRADADIDYRMKLIKSEVRAAVKRALNKSPSRQVLDVRGEPQTGIPLEDYGDCDCLECRSGGTCVKVHLLGLKGNRP